MLPPADRWSSVGCGLGQISASKDLAPVSSGPGAFLLTQMVKDLLAMRKTLVQSLSGEDPLEKGMATYSNILNPLQYSQPTPVFSPGKFSGQRSLAGYSPWRLKEWDRTERPTLALSFGYGGNEALSCKAS